MFRNLLWLTLAVALTPVMIAADGNPSVPLEMPTTVIDAEALDPQELPRTLDYSDGFILGLVEGITEYLPISSTGHLILANRTLGLDEPTALLNERGEPIWHSEPAPATGEPVPFTLEDASNAYAIIIQGGAILAVAILYWGRLWGVAEGCLALLFMPFHGMLPKGVRQWTQAPQRREGILLARNLIVAFIPAAILGLLLDDLIETWLFGPYPVIIALAAGSFLMFAVEHQRRTKVTFRDHDKGPDLHELSVRKCMIVGLLQCVAMWPGTSRSMMTIVGGYIVGLNPKRAAEFSFLLGFVTLTAASGYKTLTMGPQMLEALDLGPVLFGIAVATVSAALAVKWLVSYLTKHGLALFAWYRLALAVVVLLVIW